MADELIEVVIHMGDLTGTLRLVGDPKDSMLALQIGQAVSEWIISESR